jgi:PAS domain S-box-containing protein
MREDEQHRLQQRNTELERLVADLKAQLQEKSLQEFSSLPKGVAPSRSGLKRYSETAVNLSSPSPEVSALHTQVSKLQRTIEQLQTALQYRQRSQTALQQQQTRWQSILDTLLEGILILNREGVIESCNLHAEHLLDCPATQLVGYHILELGWQAIAVDRSPFDLEEFPGLVTAKTGIPCSEVTLGLESPHHGITWLSISSHPLFETHHPLPDAVVVVLVDMTSQWQRELGRKPLLEQEQAVQTQAHPILLPPTQACHPNSDGFIAFDRAARLTDINPEAAKTLGYPVEALLGKILWQVLPAFANTSFGKLYRRVLTEEVPIEWVDYYEPEKSWYAMWAYPSAAGIALYFRKTDSVPHLSIPHAQDSGWEQVGHPWLAPQPQHGEAQSLLRLLESVVVHANDAVMITEAEPIEASGPKILYVNAAFTRMLGYRFEEVVGQTPRFLQGPKTNGKVLQEIRLALKQGKPTIVELINYHKDGSEVWIELSLFPVLDPTGASVYWVGLQRDITQRKQTEAELQKALEKERELSDLKSTFVMTVSHEFRTPLSTILSSADMLEFYSGDCSIEKQLGHIERIQTAALTMKAMLNDILVLEQTEAGRVQFEPAQLNIRSFCTDLLEEMRLNDQNRHRLVFEQHPLRRDIMGQMDGRLLRQIFTNLLSNALKYSPKGSEIHFRLQVEANLARFEIQDHGIGIPDADQARLFEAFHRGKNVGMISGNGLGLAIVKQSVEMHQGTIEVKSQEHHGTTVRVILPLQPMLNRPDFPNF